MIAKMSAPRATQNIGVSVQCGLAIVRRRRRENSSKASCLHLVFAQALSRNVSNSVSDMRIISCSFFINN